MLGFLSSLQQMRSQAKSYKHQSKLHSIAADSARSHANAQAALIEFQSRQQLEIANSNLRTARENQRAAVGEARAVQAASGFTTQGAGNSTARQVKAQADAEIANMALSASIASHNAWQRARDTIKQGEVAAMQHESQAEQYAMASKATRDSMLWTGIGGVVGAAAPIALDMYQTSKLNDTITAAYNQGQFGEVGSDAALKEYQNTLQTGMSTSEMFASAYAGLNMGAGIVNAFNPYTATMTPSANNRKNNWGSNLSVLLGRTPYTTPQAGNVFSMF